MDYLFYTCLLLFATDVRGLITNAPLNAVAEVGQRAIFNCTSDLTVPNWVLTTKKEDVGTAAAQVIVVGCVVQPGFTTHYDVDRPGGNTNCNLIVKDTTMQQAGIYTCTDIAPGPSAILTVTEKSPNVKYNTTAGVVMEKDNVIIECVLNYNGSLSPAPLLRPYFYWADSNGQNVSSSYNSTTENTALSQLTITAGRQDITPFTCHVYFQLMPPTNTGYANNTPIVSNNASSPIVEVQYEPSTPIISHEINNFTASDRSVCTLTTLTCNSTANPPPNYTWKDVTSGKVIGIGGSIFEWAEDNRTYECTATNTIKSANKQSSASYTVGNSSALPCASVKSTDIRICSDDGSCDDGATPRSCSNASHIYLTCNVSNVYPSPTQFQWKDGSGNILINTSEYNATINGGYSVFVYNEINQQSKTPAVIYVTVTDCLSTMPPTTVTKASTTQSMSKTTETIVIAVVVSAFVLLNLIAMSVFLYYYNGTDPHGKHEHKQMLNNYFPWLKQMLPCFNKYSDGGGGRYLWVFLFILVSLAVGFIVFPILLRRANCTCCAKDAKTESNSIEAHIEFSEINGREAVTSDDGTTREQSLPSDARGELPVPYEECRITTSPPSKPHRNKNKETKQKNKSTIPKYAKVDKTKERNPNKENDPYSMVRNPDDINVTHSTAVPLPPHQIPARNPNVPLYGHVNLASPSNLPKPVQLITGSDTNYADLRNA